MHYPSVKIEAETKTIKVRLSTGWKLLMSQGGAEIKVGGDHTPRVSRVFQERDHQWREAITAWSGSAPEMFTIPEVIRKVLNLGADAEKDRGTQMVIGRILRELGFRPGMRSGASGHRKYMRQETVN